MTWRCSLALALGDRDESIVEPFLAALSGRFVGLFRSASSDGPNTVLS